MTFTLADLAMMAAEHASALQTPTAFPRLTLWSSKTPTDRTPAIFEPKFYILLQGRKRLTVGGSSIEFESGRYAVSSVGLPFTGQVTEASSGAPYLAVELALDPGVIAGLLLDLPQKPARSAPALATAQADHFILDPIGRMLELLNSPGDIPVLGPQVERELYYRLLQGPTGSTLREVVQGRKRFGQIRAAVEWICGNANKPMCVTNLARSVGMSVTSFHRHFKAVTAHSPLAYQRHIRLLEARRLLASEATSVTRVALKAGYLSPSQFSREYKRMFSVPPVHDAALLR